MMYFILHDALYGPEVQKNLLSVVKCLQLGFNFNFHSTSLFFTQEHNFIVVVFSWMFLLFWILLIHIIITMLFLI